MKYKIKHIILVILIIILSFFSYQIYVLFQPLQVVFLDVGQGDSILIQKGTQQILIDGGPSGKTELAELGKYIPYFDREIEIVIATHPDRDHIGGLIDVARNYKIGNIFETAAQKDTATFKEWQEVLDFNKVDELEAAKGDEIKFSDAVLKILYPQGKVDPSVGDANNKSIVCRLDYGENSFLFTGDIESGAEKEIIDSGENIDVNILKVAHHGSKNSSSEAFLDAASPKQAAISVGANNSYGHPHAETLDKLKTRGIDIQRTDEKGDIEFVCPRTQEICRIVQ